MSRSRTRISERAWAALLVVAAAACDDGGGGPAAGGGGAGGAAPPAGPDLSGPLPYETLGEYGFYVGDPADLAPAPGVVPFEPASPLWSDDAAKARFVVLPPGAGPVRVTGDEDWDWPVGTILIKNFSFPHDQRDPDGPVRHIETRLLVHEADGWTGHVYLWNDEQTDARRVVAGKRVEVAFVDRDGQEVRRPYLVPNTNQCASCHERDDRLLPLGPVVRQLDRSVVRGGETVNQLDWLVAQGVVAPIPEAVRATPALPDPFGDAPLEARARAYLDANCAHCHRPGGGGGSSGLVLLASETNPTAYGVCKSPVAAANGSGGRTHDIVPGHPEQSILTFRMASTDPEIKMPEIPNLVPHEAGIRLVSDWIAAMTPPGCE